MERQYGKGLIGMYDSNGRLNMDRFQYANHLTKGLNGAISTTIAPGLTIDATNAIAYWLGWAQGMNYAGLDRDDVGGADSFPELSNCFASMYSLMETYELTGMHLATRNSEPGTNKIFDILITDPTLIVSNTVVSYEMCEIDSLLEQIKGMAGADWSAVADNATRELLVIGTESPEARKEMKKLRNAATCAQGVAADYSEESSKKEDKEGDEEWEEWDDANDDGEWENDDFDSDAALDSAKQAAACFNEIDRYAIGKISGQLFASFWNNEIAPED